ncbi:MAG TPA: hypothetical protein VD965_01150 [Burkholderiales bacterium]|nr:hypothetical protein [Burkholderiales bacterium]
MNRAIPLLLIAGLLVSGSALAHGRGGSRIHLGFHFGVPLYSSWHYWGPPPVYYYPAPVYVPAPVVASPPVYTERSDVVPESAGTWYYCHESRAYYPYVRECPGGWQRVPAQPR